MFTIIGATLMTLVVASPAYAWRLTRPASRSAITTPRNVVSQRGRARPAVRTRKAIITPAPSTSSASSSSARFAPADPDSDVSQRGRIVVLGTVSPVLGALQIFSNAEPIIATSFSVTLTSAVTSVDHLLLYDHDARLIGVARLDTSVSGNATYVLRLKTKDIQIPRREEYSFYVRAKLKTRDQGGVSGETVQISSAKVNGDGAWSNRSYEQTATGAFSQHETARSAIVSVHNVGAFQEAIIGGSTVEIGKFGFSGIRGDGGADVRLTELTFTISQVGGVTLSSVQIAADGSSDRRDCTVTSSTITCMLTAAFGSLTSGDRVLTLLADVTVPSSAARASLQISLNEAGNPTTPGSVTWTDGSETFTWVGLESPVARGTYYSY
jgi:hypothetical protein